MQKMRKTTIICGNYRRICCYTSPIINDSAKERAAKKEVSTEARKRINKRTKTRQLTDLLYGNFNKTDIFVTLTYDDEHLPKTRKEAKNNVKKFIKSLRAARIITGDIIKYIYTTEDKHETGRFHHHLVINATSRNDIEDIISLWGKCSDNGVDVEQLVTSGHEYKERAEYIVKEDKELDEQSYTTSRNLNRPQKITEWIEYTENVEIPKNAELIPNTTEKYSNDYGCFWYAEYIIHTEIVRRNE